MGSRNMVLSFGSDLQWVKKDNRSSSYSTKGGKRTRAGSRRRKRSISDLSNKQMGTTLIAPDPELLRHQTMQNLSKRRLKLLISTCINREEKLKSARLKVQQSGLGGQNDATSSLLKLSRSSSFTRPATSKQSKPSKKQVLVGDSTSSMAPSMDVLASSKGRMPSLSTADFNTKVMTLIPKLPFIKTKKIVIAPLMRKNRPILDKAFYKQYPHIQKKIGEFGVDLDPYYNYTDQESIHPYNERTKEGERGREREKEILTLSAAASSLKKKQLLSFRKQVMTPMKQVMHINKIIQRRKETMKAQRNFSRARNRALTTSTLPVFINQRSGLKSSSQLPLFIPTPNLVPSDNESFSTLWEDDTVEEFFHTRQRCYHALEKVRDHILDAISRHQLDISPTIINKGLGIKPEPWFRPREQLDMIFHGPNIPTRMPLHWTRWQQERFLLRLNQAVTLSPDAHPSTASSGSIPPPPPPLIQQMPLVIKGQKKVKKIANINPPIAIGLFSYKPKPLAISESQEELTQESQNATTTTSNISVSNVPHILGANDSVVIPSTIESPSLSFRFHNFHPSLTKKTGKMDEVPMIKPMEPPTTLTFPRKYLLSKNIKVQHPPPPPPPQQLSVGEIPTTSVDISKNSKSPHHPPFSRFKMAPPPLMPWTVISNVHPRTLSYWTRDEVSVIQRKQEDHLQFLSNLTSSQYKRSRSLSTSLLDWANRLTKHQPHHLPLGSLDYIYWLDEKIRDLHFVEKTTESTNFTNSQGPISLDRNCNNNDTLHPNYPFKNTWERPRSALSNI